MKKRILYVYGGEDYHPSEEGGEILGEYLARDGRFDLETTADLDAFASLPTSGFDAVAVYTTGYDDELTPARERGLLDYVRSGGGFIAIHSAAASFSNNAAYVDMLNGTFLTHAEIHEFSVNIVEPDHYLTVRLPGFAVEDELYFLKAHDPARCTTLADPMPALGLSAGRRCRTVRPRLSSVASPSAATRSGCVSPFRSRPRAE